MAFTLDQEQVGLYKDYPFTNNYTLMSGRFVLPVALDNPTTTESPVDVIQAFTPYRMRTLSFAADKEGTPPLFPAPSTSGAFTFIGGDLTLPAPAPQANGRFRWSGSGEYVFVSTAQQEATLGFVIGQRPFVYASQDDLPINDQSQGIPREVSLAGRGPKTGYLLGQAIDLTSPLYVYDEPSYLPKTFFSTDLLNGPQTYPLFDDGILTSQSSFDIR